ncbi:MAG: tRNA (adenosine(37)-N6)-threonylcarbamoyltransferase complex dimerization subunit type 1 TsaB, partial [Pseudomonadota bacterium]
MAFDPCGETCAAAVYDCAGRARRLGGGEGPGGPAGAASGADAACRAALSDAGCAWADCDRIVVGRGPGAFSALRAGHAFAFGAGAGRGVPVVGVSGFAALHAVHVQAAALIPAGRGGVYARAAD